MLECLRDEAAEELSQVQQAIQRINDGTYRQCVRCGAEISPERLQALPFTTLCIACGA